MPEPTVKQVLAINLEKPVVKPSSIGAISAFFLLPPLGVYLLWKEKAFHQIFALLTGILGVANFLGYVSIFFFLPSLSSFSGSIKINNQANYAITFLLVGISLAQIIVSFYLMNQAKKIGFLKTSELVTLATFALLLDIVVMPLIFGVVIGNILTPVYQNIVNPYQSLPTQYP